MDFWFPVCGNPPASRLRPGPTCGELVVELVSEDPMADVLTSRELRGRLCLVDPCGEGTWDDVLIIDLCQDAQLECPAANDQTN